MARSGNIGIGSVFDEYLRKEQQFEEEVTECNKLRNEIHNKNHDNRVSDSPSRLPINLEKSRIRNQALLKDLEVSKARLRTYASYTPTDAELQQISSAYQSYLRGKTRGAES